MAPVLILASTGGCAASTATDDAACLIFRPIHPSVHDTTATQDQIAAHNLRGIAACGW